MSKKSVRSPETDPSGVTQPPSPLQIPQIHDHIGRQLRSIYNDVLNQPVPERFRELMERLDAPPADATDRPGDAS
jgi:hypothetical protein